MTITSFSGQTNRSGSLIVKQPPFLNSDQKPLEWWAEGGMVHCFNPNRPEKGKTSLQPMEALQRVCTTVKGFASDAKHKPKDYVVSRSVMWQFINEFRHKVYDVACKQDEDMGGFIQRANAEYKTQKRIAVREQKEAIAKAESKRSKIFLTPKMIAEGTSG